MGLHARHRFPIAVTLVPLALGLLHTSRILPMAPLDRLDDVLDDARVRATMPQTLDSRIVIVDLDDKSLAKSGAGRGAATGWPL